MQDSKFSFFWNIVIYKLYPETTYLSSRPRNEIYYT
ncbi:MAG: hypothetical protein JWQ14_1086, partial [Adhaeribacter sp.]|nr:hypothetical protein [Adhaeribacter sp.]